MSNPSDPILPILLTQVEVSALLRILQGYNNLVSLLGASNVHLYENIHSIEDKLVSALNPKKEKG